MRKVFLREWERLFTRPIYRFCIFVVPLFCALLLTTLMDEGLPSSLPVGVVDQDHTATTRAIIQRLDAFQNSSVVAHYSSIGEARRAVQRGHIYGFYYLPEGTTRQLTRGERPKVSFYTNNAFLMAGSLLYKDMRTMSELAGGAAGRTQLLARGATDKQAMAWLQPIVVESQALGNPSMNYNIYLSNILVPGMLSLMIFFVTVFGIGQEIKAGTGAALVRMGGGDAPALMGKLAAQGLLFLLVGAMLTLYLYGFLGFPARAGIPTMLLLMALMVVASQGMGVLFIAVLPTPRLGLSFASLVGVLSFSICGMSFPTMAMHPVLQGAAQLFPLRHYYLTYVHTALYGYPLATIWPHVAALCAFALLPLLLWGRIGKIWRTVAYQP
ncbi:MAG: ABC transporter permease [Bacteroidales bacterium]|nr:ABC transporter permease [Bacteroidales bacterium]